MSSVYELRSRMLRERLAEMVAAAERAHDENGIRLASCCVALLERHRVDDNGRCLHCCRLRVRWWQRPSRRCSVVPVMAYHLEQPTAFISAIY